MRYVKIVAFIDQISVSSNIRIRVCVACGKYHLYWNSILILNNHSLRSQKNDFIFKEDRSLFITYVAPKSSRAFISAWRLIKYRTTFS